MYGECVCVCVCVCVCARVCVGSGSVYIPYSGKFSRGV